MATNLQADATWLIADIGATSTRCALCRIGDKRHSELQIFLNEKFESLKALLQDYVSLRNDKPSAGALAIAAPISGDDVQMTNRNWSFNRLEMAEALGLARLDIINDFHAVAYALPQLPKRDVVEIGKATTYRNGTRASLGPGSGLGVGAWIAGNGKGVAMYGEGGHVSLPARSEAEERIIAKIRERYGHASAERVLSGPGIIALHSAMHGENMKTSREITSGTVDRKCRATMEQFYRFLATVAADLAMTTGAYGGVFIAGGIVPDNIEQIQASTFRERFEDKNRYRHYMQAIPTYVVTDPTPGLTGLMAYIVEHQSG
ncbi:MAG TPA: glucokinase [Woeseiaceae bacterium]|jgi:glucokinase|nr:glucokinase [Woeseiaceae bacterium]